MSALTDILMMVAKGLPKASSAAGAAKEAKRSSSGLSSLEDISERVLKTEGSADDVASRTTTQRMSADVVEEALSDIPKIDYPKPKQEWWEEELERTGKITLWHGTDYRNIQSIRKNGILPDREGKTYLSPDPDTGFGYGSMAGGEKAYVKGAKTGKAKHNPFEDRALLQVEIPKEYFEKHLANQSSEFSINRLLSPDSREKFQPYDFKLNQPYYALTELRFNGPIPKEFIVGYSQKVDKKAAAKKTEKASGGSIVVKNPYRR